MGKLFKIGCILSFIILTFQMAQAKTVPPLSGPIVDEAGLLPTTLKQQLGQALLQFQKQYGPQLQVLIIKSLEDESIEGYSIKVTDQWKLGSAKADNGVLFLVALNDRQMRIEVGQGLEGELTDLESGRIIQFITPYFKRGDYAQGIAIGMQAIAQELGGELQFTQAGSMPAKKYRDRNNGLIFFIILLFFLMLFGRGRRMPLGWFLLGMMTGRHSGGHRGGGFGGGFGGGGWSGGGGGFSGGGASGRW